MFVDDDKQLETLKEYIPEENIPEEFGGKDKEYAEKFKN